jgi:type II secretory pathway component PulK
LLEEADVSPKLDTHLDLWARMRSVDVPAAGGARLRIHIEDSGARFNLNALFKVDDSGERVPRSSTEFFLESLFEKVIDELRVAPEEKLYDERELVANLIDYIDSDDVRQRGGAEDDYYQRQEPPYRAANRPLLSRDELRLVEGFDSTLVEALTPYITVYPFAPGGCGRASVGCGVNLNTAPPHVLALLFYDDGVSLRLAGEDVVRKILQLRESDDIICPSGQSDEACTPIGDIVTNAIFPPPTFRSEVFVVTAEARVGEIVRSVEAVIDRSQADELRLLAWRVR